MQWYELLVIQEKEELDIETPLYNIVGYVILRLYATHQIIFPYFALTLAYFSLNPVLILGLYSHERQANIFLCLQLDRP